MIYKSFGDIKLSALGLGTMRLPVLDGDNSKIDMETTKKMVKYAFDSGINYFDTAWMYHKGNSELVIGEVLKEYPRDSFYLASKFPGFGKDNLSKVEEIFERQLEKCQVEYFDFYLFHNVCEDNIDGYLDPKYGIYDYLMKQKELGRIKHLGFSTHGSLDTMKRFLDAYGKDMEFCQIQLNYLDYKLQDAKAKLELIAKYDLPVWVMEPVRGGRLATLEESDAEILRSLRPDHTVPEWAFRFLQSFPTVTMTLSGMSNMAQLEENVNTFCEELPLNEKEFSAVLGIVDKMIEKSTVPCTACRYCVEKCPRSIDIPAVLAAYNEYIKTQDKDFLTALDKEKGPNSCIACRQCERLCPQGIKISEVMKKISGIIG